MCEFEFDPELWPGELEEYGEGIWSCPYPTFRDYRWCVFHLMPSVRRRELPSKAERHAAFATATGAVEEIDLVCVVLEELDLRELLPYTDPELSFRIGFSTISGSLVCSSVDLKAEFYLHESTVGELNMAESRFRDGVDMRGNDINQAVFVESKFSEAALFMDTSFEEADYSKAEFDGPAYWCAPVGVASDSHHPEFEKLGEGACRFTIANFLDAHFRSQAVFSNIDVEEAMIFLFAEFDQVAIFQDCQVSLVSSFREAIFREVASFTGAEIGVGDFRDSTFHGGADFSDCIFGSEISLPSHRARIRHKKAEGYPVDKNWFLEPSSSAFEKSTSELGDVAAAFDGSYFEKKCYLSDVNLQSALSARNITYNGGLVANFEPKNPLPLMFHNSEIKSGEIQISDEGELYELSRATVGEVDIKSASSVNPFDRILFNETNFEGFDFRNHRRELRGNGWDIYEVNLDLEEGETGFREPSIVRKEATFAKAKAGANRVGDTLAMSKFFIHEARARREQHRNTLFSDEKGAKRARSGVRFLKNLLYDVSCRYAESPSLVIGWTLSTVVIFAILYFLIGLELTYSSELVVSHSMLDNSIIAVGLPYLIFSFQSFSALVLPGGTPVQEPLIRLLAAVESFIGAFSIALFVATIIRSVER